MLFLAHVIQSRPCLREKVHACQRYARNDLRIGLPLHVLLPLIPFKKWEIDYVGKIHLHSLKTMAYFVVAIEYLTKWAEAKAVKTNTAANVVTFLFENIISRFGCPEILLSDRGTHFLNNMIQEMTDRFQIDKLTSRLKEVQISNSVFESLCELDHDLKEKNDIINIGMNDNHLIS